MRRDTLRTVYRRLFDQHGPRYWWPGDAPFEVMVGAILTQNTAWINVERAIINLKESDALAPRAILDLSPARLAQILKPSGYFNIKAKRLRAYCDWYQAAGGMTRLRYWPTARLRAALLAINGIGPETADDILLYAFHRPVFVIDAYTRRIFMRLGLIAGDESYEDLRALFEDALAGCGRRRDVRLFNEYHALIVRHGNSICRIKPRCDLCSLAQRCKHIRKPA